MSTLKVSRQFNSNKTSQNKLNTSSMQTGPAAKWSYNKIPNNEIVRAKSKQRFTEQRNLKSATVNRRSISRENWICKQTAIAAIN